MRQPYTLQRNPSDESDLVSNDGNSNISFVKRYKTLFTVAVLCFVGGVQIGHPRSGSAATATLNKLRQNFNDLPMSTATEGATEPNVGQNFDNLPTSIATEGATEPNVEDSAQVENSEDNPKLDKKTIIYDKEDNPTLNKKTIYDKPVQKIILLGERHGGTNWITDHLTKCFDIPVTTEFNRYKHWFQEDDISKVPEDSAVVIALFRDPIDWVEAMRLEPHHAHDHVYRPDNHPIGCGFKRCGGRVLDWEAFVSKPWIGNIRHNGVHDQSITAAHGRAEAKCLDRYPFNRVAPCSPKDSTSRDGLANYMYELHSDGSGRAYPSIVNLRRDKILNHLSVADFRGTRAFFPYRFEDLNDNGTAALLKNVEEATGLTAKCTPAMGRMAKASDHGRRRLAYKTITQHEEVPKEYIKWMNQFVDWEVENQIGYFKRED